MQQKENMANWWSAGTESLFPFFPSENNGCGFGTAALAWSTSVPSEDSGSWFPPAVGCTALWHVCSGQQSEIKKGIDQRVWDSFSIKDAREKIVKETDKKCLSGHCRSICAFHFNLSPFLYFVCSLILPKFG